VTTSAVDGSGEDMVDVGSQPPDDLREWFDC
jgi:hypothetical protein